MRLRTLRAAVWRAAGVFRRGRLAREIEREIASHVELQIEDNVRAGMTPAEARRQALARFGGTKSVKEAYRERGSLPMIETIARDLRYGLRMLARYPGFSAVAITTLALGMAVNTLVFGLVNSLFLRPPPITDPGRVVRIYGNRHSNTTQDAYEELRDRNTTLSGLALFQGASLSLRAGANPEHIFGMTVTGNYFDVLGVGAALGRVITTDDDRASAPPVAVLSERAWRRRFAGDPNAIGRTISINGQAYTVIGVAPAAFDGMLSPLLPELWLPWHGAGMATSANAAVRGQAGSKSGHLAGRMRPGVARPQVQAEFSALAAARAAAEPAANRPDTMTVYPASTLNDEIAGAAAAFLGLLFAVVTLVLVVACVNLATLLLARSSARARELGIRRALGAGRARLVRQLVIESLPLSILGGLSGLTLAAIGGRFLASASLPTPVPVAIDPGIDWRAAVFAGALVITTTIAFALAPALRSSKADPLTTLKESTGTAAPERARLRAILMTTQVAMSVVLLVVGAVLVRSLLSAKAIDRGFVAGDVLAFTVDVETRGYDAAQGIGLYERLLDGLEAIPGVRGANAIDIVPLTLSNSTGAMLKEGQEPPAPDQSGSLAPVFLTGTSRGHFRTLQIPIIAGRDFAADDRPGRPDVAIVNETLARRYWPGESPIGKRLRNWDGDSRFGPWIEVVGLARDSKYVTVGEAPKAFMYRPLSQSYVPTATLLVRTSGNPLTLVPAIRSAAAAVDPELAVFNVSTLEAITGLSLLPIEAAAFMSAVLGGVALVLVAIGVYGVVSYLVRQRTREIGIRVALGAQPAEVVRQLAGQGLRLTAIGIAIGVVLSMLATRLLGGLLYGVSATDAFSFVGVAALLVCTVYLAAYLPARRASLIDPIRTLRYE